MFVLTLLLNSNGKFELPLRYLEYTYNRLSELMNEIK